MANRIVTASEFKARCLALLDEVEDAGEVVTVTKRGRPVATLNPIDKKPWKSPKGDWVGKVEIVGDIVNFDTSPFWDALRQR